MKNYNLNELLNNLDFNKNKYTKVNKNIMLTNNQIEILKKYDINVENAPSLSYIIFEAQNILDEEDCEDLEYVIYELSERNYYENTHK